MLRGFEERERSGWRRAAWIISAWCSKTPGELLGEEPERPAGDSPDAQLAEADELDRLRDAREQDRSTGWVDRVGDPPIDDVAIDDDDGGDDFEGAF